MSDAGFTFSQPSSPTTGLQNYDLERGVKNLAPNTALLSVLRLRAARRRKTTPRGGQRKDTGMTDMLKSMIGTLSKSVSSIVDSGADNTADLLTKSFSEFGTALETHFSGELAKRAPEPDLLYKGLGTISRVAGLVSHLSDRLLCIKSGKDWDGQDDKKADPASEDVVAFLEHSLAAAELALRQAVNEHVEIADDDVVAKLAPGTTVLTIKSADGQDVRIKTTLPEELAKLACDPALLDQQMIDDATAILATFGANEKALSKLFDDDATLAKAFGAVQPDNSAGGTEGGAAPPNDPGAGQDPGDGTDPDADTTDVSDPMEALNVIGRLLAAGLIQLDGVIRMLNGDGSDADPGDPAGGAQDTPAPAVEAAGGGAPPPAAPKKKPGDVASGAGGMAKLAPDGGAAEPNPEVEELKKQVGDLNGKLAKILALPQSAKGVLAEFADTLEKSADAAGAQPVIDEQAIADALEKLSPDEHFKAMYKMGLGHDPHKVLNIA